MLHIQMQRPAVIGELRAFAAHGDEAPAVEPFPWRDCGHLSAIAEQGDAALCPRHHALQRNYRL